jgi:hypothetical protein
VTGTLTPHISLEAALETIEAALIDDDNPGGAGRYIPDVLYVAEIKTKRVARFPESLLARIWNECLGAKAIPFDTTTREALIAEGCKHPELKRHIEAWQKMRRTGSKWVTQ